MLHLVILSCRYTLVLIHYNGKTLFLHVAEEVLTSKRSKKKLRRYLYSITDPLLIE